MPGVQGGELPHPKGEKDAPAEGGGGTTDSVVKTGEPSITIRAPSNQFPINRSRAL